MQISPYLMFEGRTEEAIEFYKKAMGAEVEMLMRFKDAPPADEGGCGEGAGEKIMHASLRIGGAVVMASDGRCDGEMKFQGVCISVTVDEPDQVDRFCGALAEGGQLLMPPGQTFFAKRFGMVADKFGVSWMFYAAP